MKLCFNCIAYFSKLDYLNMPAIEIRDKRHGVRRITACDGPLKISELHTSGELSVSAIKAVYIAIKRAKVPTRTETCIYQTE